MTAHAPTLLRPRRRVLVIAAFPAASAVLLGAGVVLIGFPPFSAAPDVLDIDSAPWRVLLLPATFLSLVFALLGWLWRGPGIDRDGRLVLFPAAALVAGGLISVPASFDVWQSLILVVIALAAPAVTTWGVARSGVAAHLLLVGVLVAVVIATARADALFVQLHGLPTSETLFQVKFQSRAYDFHYYLLNNPAGAAAFLLLPLGAGVFWLAWRPFARRLSATLLGGGVAVVLVTVVLAYSRSALLVAGAMLVAAAATSIARRRHRRILVGTAAVIGVGFLAGSRNVSYFLDVFGLSAGSSGSERLQTLADGFAAMVENPLLGVGLGQFGRPLGYVPAHSTVVQAGAEMGVLGFLAMLALTGGAVALAMRRVRAQRDLRAVAAVTAAIYLVYGLFAAGANEAMYSGYNVVWGMTLGVLLGVAARRASSAEDRDVTEPHRPGDRASSPSRAMPR